MEYRLNKIDMELRMKINEATQEGKVHGKQELAINKDKEEEEPRKNSMKQPKGLKAYASGNKKVVVEVEKIEAMEIEANREINERDGSGSGMLLDIRK